MGVKGDSVPFAEHETKSRPERSSGKARQKKADGVTVGFFAGVYVI